MIFYGGEWRVKCGTSRECSSIVGACNGREWRTREKNKNRTRTEQEQEEQEQLVWYSALFMSAATLKFVCVCPTQATCTSVKLNVIVYHWPTIVVPCHRHIIKRKKNIKWAFTLQSRSGRVLFFLHREIRKWFVTTKSVSDYGLGSFVRNKKMFVLLYGH